MLREQEAVGLAQQFVVRELGNSLRHIGRQHVMRE